MGMSVGLRNGKECIFERKICYAIYCAKHGNVPSTTYVETTDLESRPSTT